MSGERVSIARNEAEALWRPDPIYGLDYDRTARIKAYMRGRTAEPCDEQVEAGAIALFEKQTNFSKGVNHTEDDVRDAWIHMPEISQMRFRELARAVLDAARKAVM